MVMHNFANSNIALALHPSLGNFIIFDFQSELNLFLAHFICKGNVPNNYAQLKVFHFQPSWTIIYHLQIIKYKINSY